MSKKHNNKNNEVEQNLNNEEYVAEEEVVEEETAEPEIAEEATAEEQPKVVDGEVVGNKKSCKHHHKKHHMSCKKHHKNHHHKKIDGKKVMKKIGNSAIIATYIASVTAVTCQCLTNPISTIGLITKECLELHFEKGEKEVRERMLREKIRAEYESAAVVGPAA